ncbi:MAG TPA: CoA transferase, partial [Acidimicrobiales bacterium]|nr:CoA transferase [Acidimicrobiales bacterium]
RDELRATHPDMIFVEITSFGVRGPWADRPATEFTLQAWAGSMAGRGVPDREPLAAGGRTGEWIAGAFAALAALAARRVGGGVSVDVSLLETLVLTHTVFQPLAESMGQPRSQLSRNVEIPSIEPARDGWVGFCTVQARVWHDFCALVGHPEWAEDASLRNWAGRVPRIDELRGAIAAWLHDKSVDEVIELASLMRIAVAPIGDGARTPTFDHLVARGVYVPGSDGLIRPRPPYQLDALAAWRAESAPRPGESAPAAVAEAAPRAPGARTAAAPAPAQPGQPLYGTRIVDFTGAWAGSFCAHISAMLGAEVVKIESTTRPDSARMGSVKSPPDDLWWEWAPIYHGVNTNKRSITLDLDTPHGLELAKRLITVSDVVLENFSPRVMDHFGLDWDTVHALNPRAVMVRMPAFGLSGPWRDRIGFAQTMEQASGMAWITGYPDEQPIIPRGLCDPLGGLHAAIGLLVALAQRDRTGVGELVEASMIEAALNIAAEPVLEYAAYGRLLGRLGNRGPLAAPQGAYRAAGHDEWVALAVGNDQEWHALRKVMGDPAWARDARFDSAAGRRAAHDDIDAGVAAWCATLDVRDVVDDLLAAGVPAGRVTRAWEVHENPQLRARGFFDTLEHRVIGTHDRYPGLPFRWSEADAPWHRTAAPTLGEHNDAILRGVLDLDDEAMHGLRTAGVIGERPRGA